MYDIKSEVDSKTKKNTLLSIKWILLSMKWKVKLRKIINVSKFKL